MFHLLPQSMFAQEYRLEGAFSYDIYDLELTSELQGRKGFNENQSYNSCLTQIGVEYNLGKRFDIGAAFRYTFTEETTSLSKNSVDYDNKNRLTFDLGANLKRFDNEIKIKNRLRSQMNINDDGDQKFFIREKFTFDYKLSNLWNPYTSLEVYYQLQTNEIKAYRLYLGSEIDLEQHELDFYYILEANVNSKTELFYMLGMAYRFGL